MTKAPEIVLKAGTRTVKVSEIPALMAEAIHPEPDVPLVLKSIVKAYLGPNGEHDGRTQPLTDEDMKLLVEILGTPPQPGQATTDEQWLAYIAGWSSSPKRPTWTPGRQCINAEFDAAILRAAAEDRHKAALTDAIRAGSFIPLDHAMVPLDGWTGELLEIGQVFIPEFTKHAARFGIAVRIESDRVVIRDLVDRISEATADRRPEKWQHATDPDPIRRTIVAAMSAHGWPADGIPGVLDFICTEIESGRVATQSAFNDLPCRDVALVRANPAQWYITPDAERHILQAIADAVGRTQERVRGRAAQTEKQRMEKEAAGRYTLEEAATLIATNTGERESAVLDELMSAVKEGKLTVHEPGRNLPYLPTTVRKFYEEAYWNDLNAWLDGINFRNPWRFPKLAPAAAQIKSSAQRRDILDQPIGVAIEKAGSDETADVWLQLREIALISTPPFTGVPRKPDGALGYTDAQGKVTWLTKKALGKRLARRR